MVLTLSLAASAYANSIFDSPQVRDDMFLKNNAVTFAPAAATTARGVQMAVHTTPTDGTGPHAGPHTGPGPHSVPEPNHAALFLFSLVPIAVVARRRLQTHEVTEL